MKNKKVVQDLRFLRFEMYPEILDPATPTSRENSVRYPYANPSRERERTKIRQKRS